MYPPKHFVEKDCINTANEVSNKTFDNISEENKKSIVSIINDKPLATLVFIDKKNVAHISHIPFHFANNLLTATKQKINELTNLTLTEQVLVGHVSNHHPVAKLLKTYGQAKLSLVFHGEDSYVSPHDVSFDNQSAQKVPTWNYANVHITGTAIEVTDIDKKYKQMELTSDIFERQVVEQTVNTSTPHQPWSLSTAPSTAIENMLNAITIFEVKITEIQGRFKLSQNKSSNVKKR